MNGSASAPHPQPIGRVPVLAAIAVPGLALLYLPESVAALNYFDPVKRAGWAMVLFTLLTLASGPQIGAKLRITCWLLLGWMTFRTLARDYPWAELDVLAAWLLPFISLTAGWHLCAATSARPLAWGLLLTAGIQSALMISQYMGWPIPIAPDTSSIAYRPGRMIGTIGYQNQAADALAVCAAGLFVLVRQPGWRLMLFLPVWTVIALTGSRSAIFASAAAFVTVTLVASRSRQVWRSIFLFLALSATILILVPDARQRTLHLLNDGIHEPALATRLTMWRAAWSMWSERPLTGWGAGEYALQYTDRLGAHQSELKTHRDLAAVVHARETHFDGLQFAAEFGWIGCILLVALITQLVWPVAKTLGGSPPCSLAGLYVLFYMLSASSASFIWQTAMSGPLAGLCLGMFLQNAHPSAPIFPARTERWTLLLAAFAIAAWFVHGAWLGAAVPRAIERGDLESAIRMTPRWGHKYTAATGAVMAQHQYDGEAENLLRQALAGYRDVNVFNNLGHVLARQQKWPEAEDMYARWARSGIAYSNAIENLIIARELSGDFFGAASALEAKLTLWPTRDYAPVGRLCILFMKAGQPYAAWRALEGYQRRTQLQLKYAPAEALNMAGVLKQQMHMVDEARMFFEMALAKNPQLESASKNLQQLQNAHFPLQNIGTTLAPPQN